MYTYYILFYFFINYVLFTLYFYKFLFALCACVCNKKKKRPNRSCFVILGLGMQYTYIINTFKKRHT